ncbi:hypothetical protein DFH09DRAFT_1078492 [Mycena vulgaris]|nr:hypothetical protein DFH09DRAFT_1078492 [Mycena vulgaris]
MAESVFGIQELCGQTANHMALHATSHDDLKSTALVCHTLRISAQRQIFRHVNLDPLPRRASAYSAESRSTGESVLGAATLVLRRLSTVLTASPHLLRSITSASILASPEILEPLSSIRFPVIEKISFNFLEMQPLDDNIIRRTRDWIALPSIREMVLTGFCQKLVMDHISAIFETCSSNLDALTHCGPLSSLAFSRIRIPSQRTTGADQKTEAEHSHRGLVDCPLVTVRLHWPVRCGDNRQGEPHRIAGPDFLAAEPQTTTDHRW